jgi:hypothetical protein
MNSLTHSVLSILLFTLLVLSDVIDAQDERFIEAAKRKRKIVALLLDGQRAVAATAAAAAAAAATEASAHAEAANARRREGYLQVGVVTFASHNYYLPCFRYHCFSQLLIALLLLPLLLTIMTCLAFATTAFHNN